jgi:hypothetical protein
MTTFEFPVSNQATMLRTAAAVAVLAASAEAFSTPALSGLRMSTGDAQINRKQVLQSAGAIAAGVLAAPAISSAASLDPKTGFPTGSCLPSASSADTGCSPFTNNASVLDKQKAVLAGKITVGAGKSEVLNAAVAAMKVGSECTRTQKRACPRKQGVSGFGGGVEASSVAFSLPRSRGMLGVGWRTTFRGAAEGLLFAEAASPRPAPDPCSFI